MKLLLITQKVNKHDPVLGFMHRWIDEFAKYFDRITVICLEQGAYDLPPNVQVFSLGKESGESRWKYLRRFYSLVISERNHYDRVLVHMNQLYLLLAGPLWKLFSKPSFMWRNHHAGNFLTDMAAFFCQKVFCTSAYSYTAKYQKTVLMPVGVDANWFSPIPSVQRQPRSILFLARISPVKRPDLFLQALALLKHQGEEFSATLVGDPLPKDLAYYDSLKQLVQQEGLEGRVRFHPAVTHDKARTFYLSHEIFINLSSSGMYDKTIFEAMASGCLTLASNKNLRGKIDEKGIIEEYDAQKVHQQIADVLNLSPEQKAKFQREQNDFAKQHSLSELAKRVYAELSLG